MSQPSPDSKTTATAAEAWPPPRVEQPSAASGQNLRRALFFIGYAAFITTLAQDKLIGNLPLKFLLKDQLHVSREGMAGFWFLAGLAWYFKPLAGLIADAFPVLGTRRRWYMIGSAVIAALLWPLLYLARGHYNTLLWTDVTLGAAMVMASTIMGALLVEAGQRYGATGRVSSLRELVQNSCGLIVGPIGGWLATKTFGLTAGIGAGLLLSLAAVAFFLLPEKPIAQRNARVWVEAGEQLKLVFGSRTLWSAAGLLLLFFFSPGFATPLFFRQTNVLHFDPKFLGYLQALDGAAAMVGAVGYAWICRRLPLRLLLGVGIVFNIIGALFYLNYHPTRHMAIAIDMASNFLGTFGVLPLYDLATRATPRGGEGMGYALMMSARNVAIFGADWFGSFLLDHFHHLSFNTLVALNAGTTALCLIAVPFLPRILMSQREGQELSDPATTGEQISGPEPVVEPGMPKS